MPTSAVDIIEQARDYSPLFTRQAVPDLPALKALSRLERRLASAVVEEAPDALAIWYDLPLPLPADWEDGIELPSHLMALGAELTYEHGVRQGTWEVSLLHSGQAQTQPHMYPSAYVMGGRLFLTDLRKWWGALSGWEDMTSLRLRLVPMVPTLDRPEQLITLPDTAESPLVALLALWMADRVGAKLPTLREDSTASAQGWVQSVVSALSTRSWLVEVVR
jgi:hypothetical protein